ncbi:Hypothetical protein A7982_07930 [Minicystis rosea]|nr:Hypothetical protein A7982_07930 [Minicystis rosea]
MPALRPPRLQRLEIENADDRTERTLVVSILEEHAATATAARFAT